MTQALVPHHTAPLVSFAESDRKIELLAETIMKGASAEELTHFANVCQHTGLDPFRKQIYAIKRWDGQLKREVWTFQISIDGFRLIAQQSGGYLGQQGPLWCGPDGQWREMWLAKEPPAGCIVRVFRQGWPMPVEGKVLYSEYVQTTQDGKPNAMWRKMPANQLAKCAEALALRKAFSQTLQAIQAAAPQYAITVEDLDSDDSPPERLQLAGPAGPLVADVVAARAAAREAPGKSNPGPIAAPNHLDGATPRHGEPHATSAALDNPTEFWAAAQSLLDCPRGQVASQVLRYLGQEAAAYKQTHDLSWAALYAELEAKATDGRTTAPTASAVDATVGEDDELPDDAYDLTDAIAADAAV